MTADEEVLLLSAAFDALCKIVSAVTDAKAGKIAPADALAGLDAVNNALAANNAAADAALAAKFGQKP